MPIPSPVFEPMRRYCSSLLWKDWAGFFAVRSFDTTHEREYFAIRNAAALIDVSPLFKYEVYGKDAAKMLSRIMVKDISKLNVGQVTYCCWCDQNGKVIDDGTVARLDDDYFRITAAEPSYYWFSKHSRDQSLTIEDSSSRFAALSLQGPNSRAVLNILTSNDIDNLKFFRVTQTKIGNEKVWVSRTGYTGDLGYEIWCQSEKAALVYEQILEAGQPFNAQPCGLDAMDVARIEAGFIMNGVDYFSANHCLIEARKSSPFEIGLGWCVQLNRAPFIGQTALQHEKSQGESRRKLVGLDINWEQTEALFSDFDLPPGICSQAWRDGRPVYDAFGEFIGFATSGTWSPTLKKNLALAFVPAKFSEVGSQVQIEMTVEYRRLKVEATVVKTPFFNPARKRD